MIKKEVMGPYTKADGYWVSFESNIQEGDVRIVDGIMCHACFIRDKLALGRIFAICDMNSTVNNVHFAITWMPVDGG